MGILRKIKVKKGKTVIIELPETILEKMEHTIDMQDGLVEPEVVQSELGISKKTLCNYIADGTIPSHMYLEAVNGKKKFFIYLILGWMDKRFPWKKFGKWKRTA
jgi:hypothetical protein